MKIDVIKSAGGALYPADEDSQKTLNKLNNGDIYSCTIKLNQNYRLHKKIFGFFSFCTQHYYGDIDAHKDEHQLEYVRKKLTVIAGYHKQVFSRDGDSFELIPLSLKYESMTPELRGEFYKKIVNAALKRVFDRTTDQNILNQLVSWF